MPENTFICDLWEIHNMEFSLLHWSSRHQIIFLHCEEIKMQEVVLS